MAEFAPALAKTLVNEGGSYHDPKTGEYANRGITVWTLRGLGIVPPRTRETPATDEEIITLRNLSDSQVSEIYRQQYWNPLNLDALDSQELAERVFDIGVNMGTHQAGTLLQRSVSRLAWPDILVEDGKVGTKTIAAANAYKYPTVLLEQFKAEAAATYRKIAQDPKLAGNLAGWLKRLDS
jgi:lysozyme family protein